MLEVCPMQFLGDWLPPNGYVKTENATGTRTGTKLNGLLAQTSIDLIND